jgi:hypothetical protein
MGIRPSIEIVVGAVVENNTPLTEEQYLSIESIRLREIEDREFDLFERYEQEQFLVDRLHDGNNGRGSCIVGYIVESITGSNLAYMLEPLLKKLPSLKTEQNELYIELEQMDDNEIEMRKRLTDTEEWDLAVKEHRALLYEPYPYMTKRMYDAAERVLSTAHKSIRREDLRIMLVVSWR